MQVSHDHDFVSPDGTVYLPYLSEWNATRSNLHGLVNTCKSMFSSAPPVHARPPQDKPSYPQGASPPPYASNGGSRPGSSASGAAPPYPVAGGGSSSSSSTPPPYAMPGGVGPPPAFTQVESAKQELRRKSELARAQAASAKEASAKATRQAVETKLRVQYRRFREHMKSELDAEIATQKKLEQGQEKLDQGTAALERQKEEFQQGIAELQAKNAELESWLTAYEEKTGGSSSGGNDGEKTDLDKAITPADGASKQLLECVSEANAVDDALYRLDQALERGVVELEPFLKCVRRLARQQFMSKALAAKVQQHQQKVEMQNRQPPPLNSRPPAYHPQYHR